ncbi:hypothetical protein CARUB_v10007591mg [Capsella rubella]|uniref:MADS-box domain-containing protein n=2 Tax=Capsella rubella TaxID=81985 RepID=R0F283_9BRAS|nr:hypothetical protein CARUB_v10007591mg [Capsella rubella]
MPSLPPSSSSSLASTSLSNRLETIFKKAEQLSILCDTEVCVIHYEPGGELQTWPKEREKVRDMALRYSQLNQALRRKKRVDLSEFLNEKKQKGLENLNKKRKTTSLEKKPVDILKYPISDHYSPYQISKLIQSLELNVSKLQERLRSVELQKKHRQSLASSSSYLNHQTKSLNPSQFSLFMYNHGDNTLSQIPVSASNLKQDFSALLQESQLKNQKVKQELCGYDQNINISDITNNNSFQHPCVSNKESVKNFGSMNQLMQKEFYGGDQNLYTSDITNSNVPDPSLSNTVSYEFCSDTCGNNMVGNTSFSQDITDMSSTYDFNFDESSLLQKSNLPSASTIPDSYLLSNNMGNFNSNSFQQLSRFF